jgi:hypothetical protein
VEQVLQRVEGGYKHWCPGCGEDHVLPDSWSFDNDLEKPTFMPSFKHSGVRRVFVKGEWTGDWIRDTNGDTVPYVCHYHLISGQLQFCSDSTHALAGKTVLLPPLQGS